ncbi:MAG TPA: hypothetical protein PK453_19095 [Leptospiraceae bacterium]|nr:hypothetical protein [Leptospiraceae bacterium]
MMDDLSFTEEFLLSLQNFEKRRRAELFKDYSLTVFLSVCSRYPIRGSSTRISVAGTNGKGSTSFLLKETALKKSGFKNVGLYTSPHLLHRNERIQMNFEKIDESWFESFLRKEKENLPNLKTLSFFEFYTLAAFLYFSEKNADLEIYEAGLGGRLDAVKGADSKYIVITKIAMDHSEILGDSLLKILEEKLNITDRNAKILFYLDQHSEELNDRIEAYCREKKLESVKFSPDPDLAYLDCNLQFSELVIRRVCENEGIPFHPENQFIPEMQKGRMEILQENPLIIFDITHNPAGAEQLLRSLEIKYPGIKWNILFGCLPDKKSDEMLSLIRNWKNSEKLFILSYPPFKDLNSEKDAVLIGKPENLTQSKISFPLLTFGSFRIYEDILLLKGRR